MYGIFSRKLTVIRPYMVYAYGSGQPYIYVGLIITIQLAYTLLLAGKSPIIQSYTVCKYGFGHPYFLCDMKVVRS